MNNTTTFPRLTWEAITLQLRNPFRISYGVSETRQAFWLRLANDEGWGEGTIPAYYGIPDEALTAVWQTAAHSPSPFPDDPADIPAWVGDDGPAPARAALDLALHDRIGKLRGRPLYQLLGLPRPEPMPTSFTISLDTPQKMAEMARQVGSYPIIKVKLGGDDDVACIAAIHAARPDARLRVDANAGWSAAEAVRHVAALEPFNLELIEQPTAKEDIEGMGYVQAHTRVPVVADESVQTLANVEALAAAGVQGINLKLMKVGGLAPGLRLLRRAQELGLRVMLGCMVETSLGTTAMAHLSGLAEWIDLDAPLLIANDPFDGLRYNQSLDIHVPSRPGIGVVRRIAGESSFVREN
ncbi:MAG: dipeptide epimerase [Chloroflexi bacterium]|nr:dipeptide epimerase [Chloroflexota bacterium]